LLLFLHASDHYGLVLVPVASAMDHSLDQNHETSGFEEPGGLRIGN